MSKPTIIKSRFNIFDTGRTYTGQQRGYILENIQKVFDSNVVQERLKLRQMFGYFGHAYREKSQKMELSAKDVLKMPSGQEIIVDTIPACLTVKLGIDGEGNVDHHQEIFDNDEGKKIMGLHNSKAGGFSWAASGGSKGGRTKITDLFGFDYDPRPLFVNNRGYVLDSADTDSYNRERILENLYHQGFEDGDKILDSFYANMELGLDSARDEVCRLEQNEMDLEIQVLDNENSALILSEKNKELLNEISKLELRSSLKEEEFNKILDSNKNEDKDKKEAWRNNILAFSEESVIHIPTPVLDSLISGDITAYQEFILDARSNLNMESLPIREATKVPKQEWKDNEDDDSPSFGEMTRLS